MKDTSEDNPTHNRIPWWVWSIILIVITAVLCYKAIELPIALLFDGVIQYVLHGFGVFLGVLAGVWVTMRVQKQREREYGKHRRGNLKFELEWMIRKIEGWLEELTKLEKASTTEKLGTYDGFFDFATTAYPTADGMFLAGELYQLLTYGQIEQLQEITARLGVRSEISQQHHKSDRADICECKGYQGRPCNG